MIKSRISQVPLLAIQSGIFARKYVKKISLSDRKKLVFLSPIALLQHLLNVAIEEND